MISICYTLTPRIAKMDGCKLLPHRHIFFKLYERVSDLVL